MHEPPRILVVDDNPNNVDILKTRLESHGYEIVTAADGEAALIRAVEDAPDLILLDLMMPGVDGLEVCRRLKSNRNVPFMPIVIITAKSDAKDVIAGLGAGADEYLTKPVDHASLVAGSHRCCASRLCRTPWRRSADRSPPGTKRCSRK